MIPENKTNDQRPHYPDARLVWEIGKNYYVI